MVEPKAMADKLLFVLPISFIFILFHTETRFSFGTQGSEIRQGYAPAGRSCVPKWEAANT